MAKKKKAKRNLNGVIKTKSTNSRLGRKGEKKN